MHATRPHTSVCARTRCDTHLGHKEEPVLLGGDRTPKVTAEEELVLVQYCRGAHTTVHELLSLIPHEWVEG
jgi:hypothetical protein